MSDDDRIKSPYEIPIIESVGLAEEVWDMATNLSSPKSAKAITQWLNERGIDIKISTVSRWIAKKRKELSSETSDILSSHIAAHLPSDLRALEEIEKDSLSKAKARAIYKSHEMSNEQKFVEHFLDEWMPKLRKCRDAKSLRQLSKEILGQCLKWVIETIEWDKNLRAEKKVALTAIDMKLKYTGILQGSGSGNIIIGLGRGGTPDNPQNDGSALPETETIELGSEDKDQPGKLRIVKRGEK